MSGMFDIAINDWRDIKKGYSLEINGKTVNEKIWTLEEVVKEIKKYLRLRFKEKLK
jgi:hypothetical protein